MDTLLLKRLCVVTALLWGLASPALAQNYTAAPTFVMSTMPPSTCNVGTLFVNTATLKLYFCASADTWAELSTGVPAGILAVVVSGSCPTGWTEVSALAGKTLVGTLAANGDVGTTGGADAITPAGSNTAPVFTGNSVSSSLVSAGTPAGTNGTGTVTPLGTIAWPAGVPTFAGSALATHAHELPEQLVSNVLSRWISSATFGTGTSRAAVGQVTVTANTTAAAVALSQAVSAGTPAGTVAWPAGVPTLAGSSSVTSAEVFSGAVLGTHQHTTTATGTNTAPTFTGTSFDNRSAFVKAIFCSKN